MRIRHWVYRASVDWKSARGSYTGRVPIARAMAPLKYEAMADPGRADQGQWSHDF